ncbi:branched-chain amino acid ABC transporter permease [Castellaniella sp.]|uniref:branched-chain amino acid ABC transporter permease n=1 Tax=Castellaniella sp. TaxID=1955812 RepID=UPI0035629173
MQLATIIQLLIGGLAMGAIYALVATGLYITHLATERVNFGQGDFLMVAAFLTLSTRAAGLPLWLAVSVVFVSLGVMGWLLDRIAIKPLDRQRASPIGAYGWILTTAGIAFILQNIIELTYGKSTQYSKPLFSAEQIQVVGVRIVVEEALVIITAILVVLFFYGFMYRSRWGKSIHTVAFNAEAASLLGINTNYVKVGVFVIASLLAAAAGLLIGPLVTVHPHMGLIFTIKALIVAAIGGFGNPFGILIGGLLFGVGESISNYVDSSFGDLYPLLAALLIIAIWPAGLFGERARDVR